MYESSEKLYINILDNINLIVMATGTVVLVVLQADRIQDITAKADVVCGSVPKTDMIQYEHDMLVYQPGHHWVAV